MRDRDRLRVLTRLAAVQRARRVGAEAALTHARAAEEDAVAAEERRRGELSGAHARWADHMAGAQFSPEFAGLLSGAVVGCAARVDDAAETTVASSAAAEGCRDAWQQSEARVRAGDEALRELRRKVARRRDENRTAALADRTTFAWCRR